MMAGGKLMAPPGKKIQNGGGHAPPNTVTDKHEKVITP